MSILIDDLDKFLQKLNEEKKKKESKFGIKDTNLQDLINSIIFLYKVPDTDQNGNIIYANTGEIKYKDTLRRSGEPKYMHPYQVAAYLYSHNRPKKEVIAGLLHDVLEDTSYKREDLEIILEKYVPNVIFEYESKADCIKEILDNVELLTKKGIKRPKFPKFTLKNNIKFFGELIKYLVDLLIYNNDMRKYVNGIEKSPIATNVKIVDRICNLTDFAPSDTSKWLRHYIKETKKMYLKLAKKTPFKQDLISAIDLAKKTKSVKKSNERGKFRELMVITPRESSVEIIPNSGNIDIALSKETEGSTGR